MRISAIWLWVEALEEARRFFVDVVGLKESAWSADEGILELSGEGGPPLNLRRGRRPYQQAGTVGIGLKFDDLLALRDRLERAGTQVASRPRPW